MTYPISEVAVGIGIALAVGATTLFVIPHAAREAPRQTLELEADGQDTRDASTNEERVAALERELADLSRAQAQLNAQVKAVAVELSRSKRDDRDRRKP